MRMSGAACGAPGGNSTHPGASVWPVPRGSTHLKSGPGYQFNKNYSLPSERGVIWSYQILQHVEHNHLNITLNKYENAKA